MAVALVVPALVGAQTTEGAPGGRYLLGSSVSVTPAVVFVAGHDSNAVRTSIGTPASEVYAVPQMETWIGRGRVRLNLADAVEFSRQKDESGVSKARTNHYHVVQLDAVGPRVEFQAGGSYRDHYAPPTDFAGFELGLKSRRIERQMGTAITLRPGGRVSFAANADRAALRYDADARYRGVSLEKNLNRDISTVGGDARVALTPLSSAGVAVSFFRDRFLFAPDRDGNGMNLSAVAQFSPRALVSGRVEVGYLKTKRC